ncbi:hypothetical protein AB4Z54_09245, partial [Streptomyces sp. MCAF7]
DVRRIEVEHRWAAREADVIVVPGGGYTRRDGPRHLGGDRQRSPAAGARRGAPPGADDGENRELGADAATSVEGMLEYEARGTVWTASSSS